MNPTINSYASDGKCHNANTGTYGHECGKPATWIGEKANGWRSGFCDKCKESGDEARPMVKWERIEAAPIDTTPAPIAEPEPEPKPVIVPASGRDLFA